MGFATYSLVIENEGTLYLSRQGTLCLSGPDGLIARAVAGRALEDGRWRLQATDLSGGAELVLFESLASDGRLALQRVHSIDGQSTDRETEILMDMEMLEARGEVEGVVEVKLTGIRSAEALGLSGGMKPDEGAWAWVSPKMQLGSTTVGMRRRTFAAMLIGLLFTAFGLSAALAEAVTVAAAANLSPVLPALERAFAEVDPTPVRFVVGSSGKLTTQVLQGAPFDVFLSADESYPHRLFEEGRCAVSPRVYAEGILVLIHRTELASSGSTAVLDWTRIERLAVADPALAPYGRAASEYLRNSASATDFNGRRLVGQSIGQTAQFLSSGSVDAAFLALSQVVAFSGPKWVWTVVPADSYAPIRQSAALLLRNGESPSHAATAFFEFLSSPAARAIFVEAGYRSPEPSDDATHSS